MFFRCSYRQIALTFEQAANISHRAKLKGKTQTNLKQVTEDFQIDKTAELTRTTDDSGVNLVLERSQSDSKWLSILIIINVYLLLIFNLTYNHPCNQKLWRIIIFAKNR